MIAGIRKLFLTQKRKSIIKKYSGKKRKKQSYKWKTGPGFQFYRLVRGCPAKKTQRRNSGIYLNDYETVTDSGIT